jgi:hypothetical protein
VSNRIELRAGHDELVVEDATWLTLGMLRELVAEADRLGWSNSSLVSHSAGDGHLRRHDIRAARCIVIEGGSRAIG